MSGHNRPDGRHRASSGRVGAYSTRPTPRTSPGVEHLRRLGPRLAEDGAFQADTTPSMVVIAPVVAAWGSSDQAHPWGATTAQR
jgi:hypothetical protein